MTINSMTGYGSAAANISGMDITVELKSVNHRYFEYSSKLPRAFLFLDERLKNLLQEKIVRGKVECFVQIDLLGEEQTQVVLNAPLVKGYLDAFERLAGDNNLKNDITVSSFTRISDIFTVKRQVLDEELVWNSVAEVTRDALKSFLAMRAKEGGKLKKDILQRAADILDHVGFIEERSPQTIAEYNERLVRRIKELTCDARIDEQRLLTEAAIFADKIAVAEETVRLRSHIGQLHDMLESGEAVGRKLDFLIQEINREANTIGSKAQDVEIARKVIDIKSDIEKIREQVQNIE